MICAADISGSVPAQPTYAELRQRVERLPAGQTITITVGQDHPGAIRCDDAKTAGIAVGLYLCWSDGTDARMQRIVPPAPQPANVQPVIESRIVQPQAEYRPVVNYIRNLGTAVVGGG
jgi:hypothetical protein